MPERRRTLRMLGITAMLAGALGLGVFVVTPGTAVAQEETSSTTVADETTETTVSDSTEPSSEQPSDNERPARGDHDCGDRAGDGATDGASSEESTSSQT